MPSIKGTVQQEVVELLDDDGRPIEERLADVALLLAASIDALEARQ